jgi:hypothetical protein
MLSGSFRWLFVSALLGLPVLACESAGDPTPTRAAHVHPDFPVRPSPEMIAQSNLGMAADRDRAAAAAPPPAPKNWKPSCLVHRACPTKEQALPTCEKGKSAPRWSELQFQAESMVGKTVDVTGVLGIAPTPSTSNLNNKCAPDTCCHTLRMGMTLDGEPASLPLIGMSCSGDDSKLCCSVPANSQTAIAHGRLINAPGAGAAKWQLQDATLCEVEIPQGPDH